MTSPLTCTECNRTFNWGLDKDSAQVAAQGAQWVSCQENAFWKLKFHMSIEHPATGFHCGRKHEDGVGGDDSPFLVGQQKDFWRSEPDGYKSCSYCGSISSEDFFKAIDGGAELGPTDKSYKVYVEGVGKRGKFYFQHLTKEEKIRFIELLNAKKVKIGYPGYFYARPYFIAPPEKQ